MSNSTVRSDVSAVRILGRSLETAPRIETSQAVFARAFRRHGLPQAIRCDNGTPFGSNGAGGLTRLSAWWLKLGIEPHFIRPQPPGTNIVDASNQTVMPGYWDPHFHPLNVYQGAQFNLVWAAMFAYGFTTVQSVAGPIYASTEIREWLRGALARLNPRIAQMFALRFFEGKDNPEIARLLNTTPGTVAVTLSRTRDRLEKEFRSYLGGVA